MKLIIGIGIAIIVAAVLFFAWALCRAASDGRTGDENNNHDN